MIKTFDELAEMIGQIDAVNLLYCEPVLAIRFTTIGERIYICPLENNLYKVEYA